MDKKDILIICNSFWPDINPRSFRATELVKELRRKSHEVWVMKPNVTADQETFGILHGCHFIDLGAFSREPLMQRNGKFHLIRRLVNRTAQLIFEYPDIKLFSLVKSKISESRMNFDLCISIAVPYPIHWGTAVGLSKDRIANTWIADCGDPFMGDESDSFRHPFYFKYIEKYFCRRTDYITVPTYNSYQGYYQEFWNKIKVIPQGFDFSEVDLAIDNNKYCCPSFGYAGGVIPNYREPFDFLEYLCKVKEDFRFVVYTQNPNYFEGYKEKLGDKLILNEPEERIRVLHELSKLDFVINFNNKGSKQTASKLIDYYIIQKPILNINFRDFKQKDFQSFFEGDYSGQLEIENPNQYRIENVTKKFLDLMRKNE